MSEELLALASRCEAADGPTKALDREIALTVGWVRQSPREAGRKHPAWFHPDDCHNGQVIMDSLHGTDVWRDPIAYTASLDAAMTLVPEDAFWRLGHDGDGADPSEFRAQVIVPMLGETDPSGIAFAATPALALTSATLRAKASPVPSSGGMDHG